jgi:tRNA dimethylallyltransferase
MKHLLTIVGPTAVGKSELAMSLAKHFPTEIINADSRQVYRYMSIGTSKPTLVDRQLVPHHLIDIVDPDQGFSLALYNRLAAEKISSIQQNDKLPVLVGGSGLYVWSIVEGWEIPQVSPDYKLRQELEIIAKQKGSHLLHRTLQQVDELAASKIHPNNTRRIIRALEIYYKTEQLPSKFYQKKQPEFSTLIIGLTVERDELYRMIQQRITKMIQQGFVQEVERLSQMGYKDSLPSMSSIGYNQIYQFIEGRLTLPSAVEKINTETHRLARHQYAWFHLNDKRIHWIDISQYDVKEKAKKLIESTLF